MGKNKKGKGLMRNELGVKLRLKEIVALRHKIYTYPTDI